ncbi:MAG TPA: TonB-dependent receptor [Cyclobacteriaceae bacterium]|nr:TonB-dependent receptor [Cyclobacteriaceae bacterium]HRJ82649.1 TonB-dependent receptor [Cyclobacteriaceae bacterium]
MRSLLSCSFFILLLTLAAMAQEDSLRTRHLNEVEVKGQRLLDMSRLPESSGTYLWSGRKNEVISLGGTNANIAEKTGRQIFAKVPGVFVYDMDGSGNQMNISTRGLDPHRGWEFNIRRNGSITNSDMYGYPASHYSIPMEAVDRIELVRGTGSLQYGAQFGGMLNYVTKVPDSTKVFSLENISTAGSYGLLSTYISASGTVGKFQYATYYTKRVSDGYRKNSETDYDAQSLQLIFSPVKALKLTAELSRSNYLYQIPGPLTDEMFAQDSRQATRSRNYFNPEIYVPSFQVDWQLSDNTKVSWLTSAVLGDRNSVMFDKPANVPDVIDPITNAYAPRQVDIDNFNSYTSELRLLHTYPLNGRQSKLVAGIQYFNNDLHRRQQGKGTTGTDFDLTVTDPVFGRDMHLKSTNVALFVENKFQVTEVLSITPGIRYESGQSDLTGTISYYDADDVPNTIEHKFPLLGISAQYSLKQGSLYAGWAQAYRPVIFKDIIPASVYERVDKNLMDAYGYNLEAGFRGNTKHLRWDVGVFHLQYNNRLGAQAMYDELDEFYIYRTNIGNSATTGAEIYLEYVAPLYKRVALSAFTSTALFNGRYTHAQIRSGETNMDISGNKLESVPEVITRNGVTLRSALGSVSLLCSYVGETFADAMNTVLPSATGAVGLVPGYGLFDLNSTFVFHSFTVRINVNNITNKQYFTKRPTFYPGPGIWPSDGRSLVVSVGFKV